MPTAGAVCILGQTVIDNLFPDGSDPVGKVVRFNSIPFRVIGVLKKKGYNSMGMGQDDLVLAPYTSVMKRILAQHHVRQLFCRTYTAAVRYTYVAAFHIHFCKSLYLFYHNTGGVTARPYAVTLYERMYLS